VSEHTVEALIEAVCRRFDRAGLSYGHGTDNAWDEAVALVLAVTGAADDESSLGLAVSADQRDACLQLAEQRVETRQPLAYLLGRCRYMGYDFKIRPGVIVPRSPIGYLLFEGLQPWLPASVQSVLDLCSGSGCLGIVAAHLFPDARVTLVELDPNAAALARENIALHGLGDRVELVEADVTHGLELRQRFDLILANPPYVDAADMRTLPAEFAAEPVAALAAGEDGLNIMAPILEQLAGWLSEGGLFIGEIGGSARALVARYPSLPFIWLDLPHGGEGVFALEAVGLSSHTAPVF
jgi:ribosomal protein L3 glutamine methyltransferase